MLYKDTVILLYAKAPVSGQVNTRLIPDIGEAAATQLQADFIHQRLQMLSTARLCDVRLMCAPDTQHECFQQCRQKYPLLLIEQSGSDLGQRMLHGVKQALKHYRYCIVIGTDAPALKAGEIQCAINTLHKQRDVVFVPAEDGGYVLLGLHQCYDFIFQNIHWGTAQVMQQSREILKQKKIAFTELDECWDVDGVKDYQRYLQLSHHKEKELKNKLHSPTCG